MVLFSPMTGLPLPTFSEPFVSCTVLEPAIGSGGSTGAPDGGAVAAVRSYSRGLLTLNGTAAASACVAAIFAVRSSFESTSAAGSAGPDTVARLFGSTGGVSAVGFFGVGIFQVVLIK